VSAALGAAQSIQEVAEVILREGLSAMHASGVALHLTCGPAGPLRLTAQRGVDPEVIERFGEVPLDSESPPALAARSRAVVAVEGEEQLRERFPTLYSASPKPIRFPASLWTPMVVHGGVIGTLAFAFREPRRLSEEDCAWAQALGQDCGLAVERARLFETERRARLDAEEASRAKTEFLGIVSHELRTPLTSIVGWAHSLKKRRPEDRQFYEHGLDVIERSALAQARLVDDILDMSRIMANKLRIEVKPIDLGPIVRSCVDELQVVASARGVDLEMAAPVVANALADADRLRQVVYGVVWNAIKFTPAGGHVRVDMENRDLSAFIRVRDDGRGIAGGALRRVFEAFRRGDGTTMHREGGLGLGLAIAEYIVQEHHGSIHVESPGIGRGTTVTVQIPLAEPGAAALTARGARAATREPPLTGVRLLLVEDDTDTREALAELLASEGAEVRQAASSRAGLDALNDFSPSVIVSDIGMPEEDGYAFMRKVRALGKPAASVPALALTAYGRPEDAQAAVAAGYQRHLAKPPQPRALTEAILLLGGAGG
jgi:signal transduction histidine kinase/CheY-like chemotaxis protein